MPAVSHLEALGSGAVAWDAGARARVSLRGPDTRALLHRLSTNHVKDLEPGAGRLNALLTDKGRFVDLVLHLDSGADGVLLVGSPGRGPALLAWLDRYIFSEQIELADRSAVGSCAEVAGAGAGAVVEALVPGSGALSPWAFLAHGRRVVARSFDRVDAQGATVPAFVVLDDEDPGVLDALRVAGAAVVDTDTAEALRIAAGVPGHGGELVEAYNPLDLALHDAVHWAKGCYIGQEVIARLDTYAKQGKQLVGLVAEGDVVLAVHPGSAVVAGGRAVGVVTSVSPRANGPLPSALAVVQGSTPDDTVSVETASGPRPMRVAARAAAQRPHD